MSGIAAIVRFDERPLVLADVARLTDAIAYRGPDGIAHHLAGAAALGHCQLRATAEAQNERQPLANDDGSAVLVFDGYFSHREDLRAELLARGVRLRDITDAELVLRAWETWGDACPTRIEGAYAFAIWDSREQALFCARDVAGMRPLHYHSNSRRLVVSSDIAGVIAAGDFPLEMNRGMAAEHLATEWHSLDETIWTDVMRLPPGCTMRADAAGTRVTRYWEPSPERWRRGSDADLAADYREMLADCVRRDSRTNAPLACDVSGGLDSSAIFALAHRELAAGRLPAPSVDGYSYVFGAGRPEDEIAFAQAVAGWVGAETTPVTPFLPELSWFRDRSRADFDLAPYPNAAMTVSVGEALVARGSRVSLNGEGGDNWLTGQPWYYAEHLADRDGRALARSIHTDFAALGLRETGRRVWRHGISPMAPMALRRARRARRDRDLRGWHGGPLWWLPADMQELLRARRADSYSRQDEWRRESAPYAYLRSVLDDPFTAYAHEFSSRIAARIGYERRSPMNARAFIEFAFAVNSDQRLRGDETKVLHVRAMEGLLPPDVLQRTEKVDFAHPFERLLDNVAKRGVSLMPQRSMELVGAEIIELLQCRYANRGAAFRPRDELWSLVNLGWVLDSEVGLSNKAGY